MEEMLNKFTDEGKQEHEEMRAFIYDFQTTNELLFKERNNSLIEFRFRVQELLKVINNVLMIDCDVKGVTTRGGKTTTQDVHDNDTNVLPKEPVVVELEKPVGSNEVLTNDQPQITSELVVQPSNEVQTPLVPFPRRLRKEKKEAQQKKFLENLKQLHINLPFIEALAQMPKYAKFLKGFLTNKARLEEACKIIMNERCSTVLLNKLPSKEKDPGSFTIPYDIGQLHINNALADLGASISLMPYTMYKKHGLGELKASRMSLELADRSIQYPRGIIENTLIKITLRVGDDEVIFDVDQSIKRPTTKDDECYGIDDLEDTINEEAHELLANEEPGSFLSRELEKSIDQSNLECCEYASSDEKNGSDLENSIRRFFQIPIAPKDQEKTTFTCPYGTFAYRRTPFGLCNAPATFQRCMTAIFHDMVEDFMEVFMDNFSVFGSSFDCCLANLDRILARYEETNLVPNWENCHFMVKEGIVLGHKISGAGIEVDRAKIDVIAKLPYPTNVKGVRSFLGHAGFYRSKEDAKPRLIRWVLLLQGFDIEIKDKKGQRI
ncbi:reverse transcriptase domain-containing protein [Tanacetum coccineum]